MNRETVWSFGGGVQTIAILVLIARGELPKPELTIVADTGRERSSTWRYLDRYAKPILDELNIPFVIAGHDLATVDLYGYNGDLLLPSFTQTGKLRTFCSDKWKKLVVRRKLRELGYGPKRPVLMWLGMSLDETHRLRVSDKQWIENHYPLCFDIRKRRHECELVIADFGLPKPPKSTCWMCPHLTDPEWLEIKKNDPDDFKKAVELDYATRQNDERGGVFLHRSLIPLDQVDFNTDEPAFPLLECADSCWT